MVRFFITLLIIVATTACPLYCGIDGDLCCADDHCGVSLQTSPPSDCCCCHNDGAEWAHEPGSERHQHSTPCQGICSGAILETTTHSTNTDFASPPSVIDEPCLRHHLATLASRNGSGQQAMPSGRMLRTVYMTLLC